MRFVNGKPRKLGWKRDSFDHRDLLQIEQLSAPLPDRVDLSQYASRIEDQGDLGSCTANASTSAMEFLYRKAGMKQPEYSRLFLYYWSRVQEGTAPSNDSGCMIRDVMKTLASVGCCTEDLWPYVIDKFSDAPPKAASDQATHHKITRYHRCADLTAIRHSLALEYPVVLGFEVPENFFSVGKDGIVHYPAKDEKLDGGHCVYAVGYDVTANIDGEYGALLCVNSWGEAWGMDGKFWMPFSFVTRGLADDFWVIRKEGM